MESDMTLLAALGLTHPQASPSQGSAPPLADTRSAKKGGAPKPAVDGDGGKMTTVKVVQLSLGVLRWQGHQGQLLAFTDDNGALVKGGPRVGWRAMGSGNMYGGRIVHALADLDSLEKRWRDQSVRLRKGTADGLTLLKKVREAMAAVTDRKGKDDKFQAAMTSYIEKSEELGEFAIAVQKADHQFMAKLDHLAGVMKDDAIAKVKESIEATEAEKAGVEKEIQQVKDAVNKVLSVATKIRDLAVSPDATKVVGMVSEGISDVAGVIIDGQYAGQLARLDTQLEASKEDLGKLVHDKAFLTIQEAQDELRVTVSDCESAQKKFTSAIQAVIFLRAKAVDRAGDSPSTKIVGEAIARRAAQQQLVLDQRNACATFLAVIEPLAANMPKFRDRFRQVGDWIDDIAVDNPQLARNTPWANACEFVGQSNSLELSKWIDRVGEVRTACQEVAKEVAEDATASALAPYEAALAAIKTALGSSTIH
jgi:hypothetical protein